MRSLSTFLFVVTMPLAGMSQNISTSDEPVSHLYQEINNSLPAHNPKTALRSFKRVVNYYIQHGRASELPERYFGMALGLALNGHYRKSIRYHKKAITLHHKYRKDDPLEISINLGLTYYLAGKDRKAKRILGDAI
jgi:tetratricopeptide (TPR) repeat protein